jgi:predicted HAD superfamily Cof-like phosphohydrolase
MKQLHITQKEFNTKFGFEPSKMTYERLLFRHELAKEEVDEMYEAIRNENPMDVIDALIDQIYIAYGTLNMLDIDINKAFFEVHKANMKKLRGKKNGRNNSYDVHKPEGWEEPNHINNIGILKELLEI